MRRLDNEINEVEGRGRDEWQSVKRMSGYFTLAGRRVTAEDHGQVNLRAQINRSLPSYIQIAANFSTGQGILCR